MNNSEHIHYIVGLLADQDRITVHDCIEIIQAMTKPYIGKREPAHFAEVNQIIHRLLKVGPPAEGEDQ